MPLLTALATTTQSILWPPLPAAHYLLPPAISAGAVAKAELDILGKPEQHSKPEYHAEGPPVVAFGGKAEGH